MIDLRDKSLPKTVKVEGKDFLIKTDFRLWLDFDKYAKTHSIIELANRYYVDGMPKGDWLTPLVEFYSNENSTPNFEDSSDEVLVDFIEDGEYIVASFMKDYGIDLTECDLHWHMFKALFLGLSEDTKIKQIISMRGYKKDNRKPETIAMTNKRAWSLKTKEDEDLIKLQQELFGG